MLVEHWCEQSHATSLSGSLRQKQRAACGSSAFALLFLLVWRKANPAQMQRQLYTVFFGMSLQSTAHRAALLLHGLRPLPALPDAVLTHVSRLLAGFAALGLHHALCELSGEPRTLSQAPLDKVPKQTSHWQGTR